MFTYVPIYTLKLFPSLFISHLIQAKLVIGFSFFGFICIYDEIVKRIFVIFELTNPIYGGDFCIFKSALLGHNWAHLRHVSPNPRLPAICFYHRWLTHFLYLLRGRVSRVLSCPIIGGCPGTLLVSSFDLD